MSSSDAAIDSDSDSDEDIINVLPGRRNIRTPAAPKIAKRAPYTLAYKQRGELNSWLSQYATKQQAAVVK